LRPVELQATVAHAAGVLAFFAEQLGLDASRWRQLHADYRQRTRQLFDPQAGRYRDWLIAEQTFVPASPENPYWGIDAGRYSAQSLTPPPSTSASRGNFRPTTSRTTGCAS
jgi:hypothetical protein